MIILPTAPPTPKESRPVHRPDPATLSHIDNALAALGALSDRIGVTIAFRSDLSSFAALGRALTTAHCPTFAIDFDPVAALRDEWPLDEIFSRLGPLIRHVRARDAIVGEGHRTKPAPIGAGSANWPELLSLLDQTAYNGWLTIDPMELADRPAAAIAALSALKKSGA